MKMAAAAFSISFFDSATNFRVNIIGSTVQTNGLKVTWNGRTNKTLKVVTKLLRATLRSC
ncbi:unnamed protein product [Brugia timori]|uniref:Uncharacterized protein n=1 Tax=Brugia timori TaxID=42155 RepID=A0A3P7SZJ3_9BILA|nr:unnamed protein product [Brugia timori]